MRVRKLRIILNYIDKKLFRYGIRIGDLNKYQLAFVHKSVYMKDISPPVDVVQTFLEQSGLNVVPNPPPVPIATFRSDPAGSNPLKSKPLIFTDTYEAMEFSGDGWVGAVVGQYVKNRFPRQSEGFYTRMKHLVVCKDGLSKISQFLGFEHYALLSDSAEQLLTRTNPSLLEDIFEAFCDAIVEDQGVGMLRVVIKNLTEAVIDFRLAIINDTNFKDVYKRCCRENDWPTPVYIDLGDNGLIGSKKEYCVGIRYHDKAAQAGIRPKQTITPQHQPVECISIGSGATKKKAQQAAALNAMNVCFRGAGTKNEIIGKGGADDKEDQGNPRLE